jgi:hypothetical protein
VSDERPSYITRSRAVTQHITPAMEVPPAVKRRRLASKQQFLDSLPNPIL